MSRFAVLLWLSLSSAALLAADEPQRAISVTGTGFAVAVPDEAHVNLSIQVRDTQLETARAEVISVTRRVLSLADDLGLAKTQVRSTGTSVNPEYQYNKDLRKQELVGYYVARRIDIHLKDLEQLGELIEQATDAGVNQISSPQLRYSKSRELHREALAAAAKDAQANARVMAGSLDSKLGEVHQINDSHAIAAPQPMRQERMMAKSADSNMSGADTYSSGEIRIDAQVRVTFRLQSN